MTLEINILKTVWLNNITPGWVNISNELVSIAPGILHEITCEQVAVGGEIWAATARILHILHFSIPINKNLGLNIYFQKEKNISLAIFNTILVLDIFI